MAELDLPEEELEEYVREEEMERGQMLPVEVLCTIFKMLPPKDVARVILVCKRWHQAADTPILWTWVTFHSPRLSSDNNVRNDQEIARFLKMVTLRRLLNVKHICFSFESNIELVVSQNRLVKAALEHPGLRKICLESGNITLLDPQLLTQLLIKMDEVEISGTRMSTQQKTEFFSALHNTSHMKRLVWTPSSQEFQPDNFKAVDPTTLANAVKNVEKLHLNHRMTSAQQAISIFHALQSDSALVKTLSYQGVPGFFEISRISDDGRNEVDPDVMSRVVRKLEEVDLTSYELTYDQSSAICAALSEESTLQKLTLRDNPLHMVDVEVLARMVRYVEDLDLSRTGLRKEALHAIFASIGTGQRLKKLSLAQNSLSGGYNYMDDSDEETDDNVDPHQLAEMARCVEELDLSDTNMKAQAWILLRELGDTPGKLIKLVLQGNDLRDEDISAMVTQIQDLDLSKTKLSPDQVDEMFEEIADGPGRLKILRISNIDVRGVIPELLSDAVNSLERVYLTDMPLLTRYQVKKILTQALEEGTYLEELSIVDDFDCQHHHHSSRCDCRYYNGSVFDGKFGYENQSLFNELFQL